MSDKKDLKEKVINDPDYIYSPKYDFSLKKFIYRHDEGVENTHAAKVLLMEPDEIDKIYERAIKNLQEIMKGESNE
jgi:hypothetical protein